MVWTKKGDLLIFIFVTDAMQKMIIFNKVNNISKKMIFFPFQFIDRRLLITFTHKLHIRPLSVFLFPLSLSVSPSVCACLYVCVYAYVRISICRFYAFLCKCAASFWKRKKRGGYACVCKRNFNVLNRHFEMFPNLKFKIFTSFY